MSAKIIMFFFWIPIKNHFFASKTGSDGYLCSWMKSFLESNSSNMVHLHIQLELIIPFNNYGDNASFFIDMLPYTIHKVHTSPNCTVLTVL